MFAEYTGAARPVLLIDEPAVAEALTLSLKGEGFAVIAATDGAAGVERFRVDNPALVLLDLKLPRISGLDVCRILREESTVPIMVVSARDSEADKVASLEMGADDFMTKPFSLKELVSRMRAHLRRAGLTADAVDPALLRSGPVELDASMHEVRVRGERVDFTPKEFDLLETFLRAENRLRTRGYLIDHVWGPKYFGDTKTLDVHVMRLRTKIERDPHRPEHLITVRGLGYRFLDQSSARTVDNRAKG